MDCEEFQPFVVCLGAPIRDFTGAVVGSISASTPTMRASEDDLVQSRSRVAYRREVLRGFISRALAGAAREAGADVDAVEAEMEVHHHV